MDLARIFTKSNLLEVRFHPLHPRLLHHCHGIYRSYKCAINVYSFLLFHVLHHMRLSLQSHRCQRLPKPAHSSPTLTKTLHLVFRCKVYENTIFWDFISNIAGKAKNSLTN